MADPAGAYYHHHHHHLPSQGPHYPSYYEAPPPPPGSSQQPPPPGLHPQYYPPPPPPPPYGAAGYAHASLQPSDQDEVRTLFIAGLPDDVKSREIYNLFREFSGYQSCQVRCSGQSNQYVGLPPPLNAV
ncbi:hypothetical protein Taro_023554 [Colocasia esculenta]|uniref:RRM domain-containing protein n=1 Tax=Colocasia esculenta TaxID=4460 RepID=A0A843V6T0_COLES|nr:hypothetical protein [Colocasia esculenta]